MKMALLHQPLMRTRFVTTADGNAQGTMPPVIFDDYAVAHLRKLWSHKYNLPSALQNVGAMLVLPDDISQYEDVINRWESITVNIVGNQQFNSNKEKVDYIENLLGEIVKLTWLQWKLAFPVEYEGLITRAENTYNITSFIRRMIIFTDPGTGTTRAQELAYMDLERLSCNSPKDIFQYMNDYKVLAAKSGRMWIGTELSDKFFRKMPQMFGTELEKAYNTAYPGNTVGVLPRIYFAYQYLAELCRKTKERPI
nr:polyprotein [Theobroma cacao]